MPLTNQTRLVVAEGVSLLRNSGVWDLANSSATVRGDRYTLSILTVFSSPQSVKEGINQITARLAATPAWVEVVANVKALVELGFLVSPEASAKLRRAHASRFDSAPIHIQMLNDVERTSRFQSAIRRTVKPDDVVVDVGTGTGVLAITAAQAGARHVYALETTSMSDAAQRMIDANGLQDRVSLIGAHSFDIELPERATLLVSETIGDDPLGERILPTFADAKRRLLAVGARSIPSRLKIQALPLEVPPEQVDRLRFTAARADAWAAHYGLDFRSLVASSTERDHRVKINSCQTRGWRRCSPALTVADLVLLDASSEIIDNVVSFSASNAASVSGVLVFFEADLGAGVRLSIHPDEATPGNSWGSVLQLFAAPVDVAPGEELSLHYHFDDRGSRIELRRR